MKRVVIVHGWYGNPEEGWFPWLKKELEKREHDVYIPSMPNPHEPEINSWVEKLSEVIHTPADDLILVGHSIGCQTILRYLATLSPLVKIAGVVMVAPWVILTNINDEEKRIAVPWLDIDTIPPYPVISKHVSKDNFYCIFSDNDKYVPLEDNSEFFQNRYGSKVLVEKNKGHMGGDDKILELPIVLSVVNEITQ